MVLLFSCCLRAQDDDPRDNLYQARILFNQGKYQQAIDAYEPTKQEDYFLKVALLNQALIYKDTRQYEQAIKLYKKLLTIEENKMVFFNLGEVYYLNCLPDKAISAFNQALNMGYRNGMIYFWLGRCLQDKGNIESAKQSFQQAVAVDDSLVLAHLELGSIYAREKILLKAQEEFEKVRELDPSITEVYPALAEVYFDKKEYEEALKAFHKVLTIDPDNAKAQQYIDLIHKIVGKGLKKDLEKKEEKRLESALAKEIIPKEAPTAPVVKVLIGEVKSFRFKSGSDFSLCRQADGAVLFSGAANTLYGLSEYAGNISLLNNGEKKNSFTEAIVIILADPHATILLFNVESGKGEYWASITDRSYRGQLEVAAAPGILRLINTINMEEYLYGVVPSEMSANWPQEALKAQAVAARSEAYVKMKRHAKEGYNFCPGVHCQVYGGANVEASSTNKAVDQTCGQIGLYEDKPIDAIYSNSCGGHTQSNIFGECEPIPYLQGIQDVAENIGFFFPLSPLELEDWLWMKNIPAFCNNVKFSRDSNFRWMRTYSRKQLEKLINKQMDIGTLKDIIIRERSDSSHIQRIEIIGSKGKFEMKKELNIRNLLGNLRSSMFNIDVKLDEKGNPEEFIFYGGGWGHAVGMCQVGAATMAQQGYSYIDILKFYYSGIEIKRMY